ncbi:glycoside hydrolase family protein [Bacillus sp. 3255]|uniref:glycoside hydrolase family protein n=1 Tax=Bacillus sp. 3255 TaxID=2817904 RepID=UPI00285A7393|nr:glycoside hydrolase family protein [Bacillus sp. 3255]MDR6881677.1 hypothetical protein [Bacillus sp. 3255]
MDIYSKVKQVPHAAKMMDDEYYIWCTSVVEGHDGKYHMLYSRWPKSLGHYAWVTDSEVAYAVADHALGPYEFQSVALLRRGASYWDGVCTHNPTITRIGDLYYLYYTGTTGKAKVRQPASMSDPEWWEYRNNQRIGVAVAEHPAGPWQRFDRPAIDISDEATAFDSLAVTNPSATTRPDGGVLVIYKGITRCDRLQGGQVLYGAAIADKPEGPYVKQEGHVFEHAGTGDHWMVAEDPFIWHDLDRYYALTRDVVGIFTGENGGIALFESYDGLNWQAAAQPKALGNEFQWEDGTFSGTKLERPQLLIKDGVPQVLFGAVDVNMPDRRSHSFSVFIPLV